MIRAALPGDLEKLIPLLDEEFVFGKGRRISLAQRFPAVYCPGNINNIYIVEENGLVISALATKHFDWLDNGELFHGAMLGAVYTHPLRRKEGWASRLLGWVAEKLKQDGIDFAVLWTAAPAFYARIGWVASDCGLLGEITHGNNGAEPHGEVETVPANSVSAQPIEHIRRKWLTSLILRDIDDYRQLPLPAEMVNLLCCYKDTEISGYALVGCNGDTNIIYEMVGNPDSFQPLWCKISTRSGHIIINERHDSASHRWLAHNTSTIWHAKPLAMWLPLSGKTDMVRISGWYVSYYDRI